MMASNATCGVVVDRHVPKNAGSTMRSLLRQNAALGRCKYVGYDVGRTWASRVGFHHQSLVDVARELRKQHSTSGEGYCIEAHMVGPSFWADLHAMRALPYAVRCPVVLLIRVREPLSWYQSYYNWAVFSRQERGDTATWGANFTDWLPPNMQCRFLLHGTHGQASEWASEMAMARRTWPRRLSDERWRELERLVRTADVLAPLDRLDESIALLRRISVVLGTSEYATHIPTPMHGPWERKPKVWPVERPRDFCERVDCAGAVRKAAPDDHRLYELATATFHAQWHRHCSDGSCADLLPPKHPPPPPAARARPGRRAARGRIKRHRLRPRPTGGAVT